MSQPNFENLLKVLRREVPERPTLFEFFLNVRLYRDLAGLAELPAYRSRDWHRMLIKAFGAAGYDYTTVTGSAFGFPRKEIPHQKSRSMSEGSWIVDRASFDSYPWPNPDDFDYAHLADLAEDLPAGMKLVVNGPGGVLENAMDLVGYEPLCYLILDDPELVGDIFEAIGTRLIRHYELAVKYDTVGALISNDDWGFSTQTMLAPADMRRYVFPWHKRIVETIHAAGKPVVLHSCGNLESVMDDVIDDMKYDGKHSYEDKILPVEEAYEKWGSRIAIMGGIDVDFVCRATPTEITARSRAMIDRAASRGGFALGTGNSVPEYVPDENYFAMTSAATADRA